MYGKPHLDQVLFSIGLTFMAVAAVDYAMGSQQVRTCRRPTGCAAASSSAAARCTLGMGALPAVHRRGLRGAGAGAAGGAGASTRFGSRLRAAVDDPRVAAGLGIPVDRVFLLTFAFGSGLAGLGGALGVPTSWAWTRASRSSSWCTS
jgi:branched-chain amino acid transport system permease protein